LDIGGGFPVEYRETVPALEEIAAKIRPLIEPLMDRLTIIAEPGRFVAAPASLLVTSVVGTNQRYEKPWYYLDDGLYGAYSICIYEGMKPHLFAHKELRVDIPAEELQRSVVAGPSCDSIDMVAEDYPLPKLDVGDLLISPMMGAYSTVSGTNFNGIPFTKIVALPH
jgi:ornithine decarboxylase